MKSGNHLQWVIGALLFGALMLPYLVYATGVRVLGPYDGGAPAFYTHYVADLVALRPAAWTLALGPALFAVAWRGLVAWAWRTA